MIPQKNVAPAVFEPATSWNCQKKKSARKINENDLKIAWKCTLRQSSFKNFPGEAPGPPYKRRNPSHTLPLSRRKPFDTCLRQSMPPRLPTFWVQPWCVTLSFIECVSPISFTEWLSTILQVNGYTFRGDNLSKLFCLPSEKGSTLKRKEFAPKRSKFFPF